MNLETAITEIKKMRRFSKDQGRAERAVADAFKDEYAEGISGHPKASNETNKRSLEIYCFAIKSQHNERQHLHDVEVFDAILFAHEAMSNG